jgi:hypothetical protein
MQPGVEVLVATVMGVVLLAKAGQAPVVHMNQASMLGQVALTLETEVEAAPIVREVPEAQVS